MKIPLKLRCDEVWEGMDGSGSTRTCASCDRSVTDLSALTERQARRLLTENPTTCVRYRADAGGHVVFPPSRLARVAAALLVLVGAGAQASAAEADHEQIVINLSSFVLPPRADGLSASPGELVLRVVDTDEIPVPLVRVELHSEDGPPTVGFTDETGISAFSPGDGRYRAVLTRAGFASVTVVGIELTHGLAFEVELRSGSHTFFVGQPSRQDVARARRHDRLALREGERLNRVAGRMRAVLRLSAEPGRVRDVAVRCAGGVRAVADLWYGSADVGGLPVDGQCALRVPGDPPLVVRFTAGDEDPVTVVASPSASSP